MMSRRILEPNVTFINLIDVTLVLLIIFMITAPAIHDMITVDLPSGKASKANISEGMIVTIKNDGSIFVDKEKIDPEEFELRFTDILKKRSGEPAFIRGDEKVPYGTFIDVLSKIKSIGVENVGLVVEERVTPKKK